MNNKLNRIKHIIVFTFPLILLSGCTIDLLKDFDNCIPSIEIVSIKSNNDTTIVTGKIVKKGANDVQYTGFCYNKSGNPNVIENQILLNGTNGEFSTAIFGLEPDTFYYFKAFAANDCGYTASETFQYSVPMPDPPIVPCTLTDNVIVPNGFSYNVSSVYTGAAYSIQGEYGINASCYSSGGPTIKFDFHKAPLNGIYTTCNFSSFSNSEKNVYVSVKSGILDTPVNSGGKIYIEKINNDTIFVSFCDLTYTPYSSSLTLKGKFQTH